MNNYHYIAIQKAASWKGNEFMIQACVTEFNQLPPECTTDTASTAITAARANHIDTDIINHFEA